MPSSPKKKRKTDDPTLTGLDRYIRTLYKSRAFPGVDENGAVYLKKIGATGHAAVAGRESLDDQQLKEHLRQHFPQGAIHHASDPESRAMDHVVDSDGAAWDDTLMILAAREFEVPASTKMFLFFPEIFDRAILQKDPSFRFEYTSKDGKKEVGVKTPCPWCKTNKYVNFKDKSGYRSGLHKTIADIRTCIPIYGFRLECTNPACVGDPKSVRSERAEKAKSHNILSYNPLVFDAYPDELRRKYRHLLYAEADDGAGQSVSFTRTLATEVLKEETHFTALTRHMMDAYDSALDQAIAAYVGFQATQSTATDLQWPDFGVRNFRYLFGPPSNTAIVNIFNKSYALMAPVLRSDLYNRLPGKSIRMNTFQYVSTTKNDKGAIEETTTSLCVIWDEYGRIVSWAFGDSDTDRCFQRLCYYLRERCKRLGHHNLYRVKAAYSFACCQGQSDPSTHWITTIWPGISKAPTKDIFHAQRKVMDATQPGHQLRQVFAKLLCDAFLQFDEPSKDHVVDFFLKKSRRKMTRDAAKEEMVKLEAYTPKIKNVTPPTDTIEQALRDAYAKVEEEDERLKSEAASRGDGYLPFLLPPKRGIQLGTKKEMENLLLHVRKGCCQDPFGVEDMNMALDPEAEYPDYLRARRTTEGEACSRLINQLINELSTQSAGMADKQLWLRITRYNLERDRTLQKLLGIKNARSWDWCIHEALLKRHAGLSMYQGTEFPLVVREDYYEPLGIEYGKHDNWEDVQEKLDSWVMPSLNAAVPDVPETMPTIIPNSKVPATHEAVAALPNNPPVENGAGVGGVHLPVSIVNVYVDKSKPFTNMQMDCYWKAIRDAQRFLGPYASNLDQLAETAARNWNQQHLQIVEKHANIGMGGMIRVDHVRALLKEKGTIPEHVVAMNRAGALGVAGPPHQVPTAAHLHPTPAAKRKRPATKKMLTRDMIAGLSFRSCADWLRYLNIPMGSDLDKRRKRLHEFFDKHEDGHVVFTGGVFDHY